MTDSTLYTQAVRQIDAEGNVSTTPTTKQTNLTPFEEQLFDRITQLRDNEQRVAQQDAMKSQSTHWHNASARAGAFQEVLNLMTTLAIERVAALKQMNEQIETD